MPHHREQRLKVNISQSPKNDLKNAILDQELRFLDIISNPIQEHNFLKGNDSLLVGDLVKTLTQVRKMYDLSQQFSRKIRHGLGRFLRNQGILFQI